MNQQEKYPLMVGSGLEDELLIAIKQSNCHRVAIITDSQVKKLWGDSLLQILKKSDQLVELFSFPAGEQNKNQKTITTLQHQLLKKRYGRDTLIIAFGGGVVGDVAGFVAATYLRGVPYIHLPTTLLAMVDSSIGGKVGIDTPYGKNTIGAFYQPIAIVMDLNFVVGLPKVQVINGLLEAIKTFFTSDKSKLVVAKKLNLDQPQKTPAALQEIIWCSVRMKAGITERDEKEGNERKILNFGHTIGHALELLSSFTLPHGYAVGYGMLVETKIAELLGILSPVDCRFVHEYLAQFGIVPAALHKFSITKIIKATKGDKKTQGGKPQYVLLNSIGSVYQKNGQFAHPVSDTVVKKALQSLLSS